MKIPDKEIRIGLTTVLASLSVPVYAEMAIPGAVYPRVTIKSINSLQEGSKNQFMYETDVTLEISDRRINLINPNIVDDIANDIAGILVPSPQGLYLPLTGFRIWFMDINSSVSNVYEVKPHQYIDKNIRITIKIEQL